MIMTSKKLKKIIVKNKSNMSMILGILVIIVVGLFIIRNYNNDNKGEIIPAIGIEQEDSNSDKYTVQKGDTLWSISEKTLNSGHDWKKIAQANDLYSPYNIEEGQKLLIPEKESEGTNTSTQNITQNTDKPISGNLYEVVKGDSLWNIAVRAYGDGYKWVDISKANNLVNPGLIHAGNVFVIPR